MTRREYLVSKGLAKPGRGKFSKAAIEALDEAKAQGIVFDEDVHVRKVSSTPRPAPKPKKEKARAKVDAKAVRAWASENGIEVGKRGRIDAAIINRYLDAMAEADKPVPVPVEREKDNFGDARPRLRANDKYVATDLDLSKITLSERDCCVLCHVSLGWCACPTPYTWSKVDTSTMLALSPA